MSRDKNPWESNPTRTARDVDRFMGRIQRAFISAISTRKGTCTITFDSTPGERSDVPLPIQYFSLPKKGKRHRAAWKRYMPQEGDLVLVGFDTNGSPRILGYEVFNYETVFELDAEDKFGFVELKQGEFDERSSGGAYYKGDDQGTLLLSGGLASITLNKKRYETVAKTGLWKLQTGASTFRRGVVKRPAVPFSPEEEARSPVGIPLLPNPITGLMPTLVEDTADIRTQIPGTPFGVPTVFRSYGDVLDPDADLIGSLGGYGALGPAAIKRLLTTGMRARLLWRIYDQLGLPGPIGGAARPFEWAVDEFGNSFMNVGIAATAGFNVWANNYLSLTSSQMVLQGNVFLGGQPYPIVAGIPAPLAPLRTEFIAGGPAICGTPFLAALTLYLTAASAFATVAATGTAVTSPVDAVVFCKALGAAALPFGAAAVTLAGSSAAWLSKSVFIAAGAAPVVVPPVSLYQLLGAIMGLCVDLNNGILNTIARCLINTLLNLAAAVLEALRQFLLTQVVALDIIIANLIAKLAQYDILSQQAQKLADFVNGKLDEVTGFLSKIPLGLLDASCLEWAGLNGGINQFINDEIRPPIDAILLELIRITSIQRELQALKAEYEALKQLFSDVIDMLKILILERKCREAAGVA